MAFSTSVHNHDKRESLWALYRAFCQKIPPATGLAIEKLSNTAPLSVTRREDIDQLRETAQGRLVNVR